MKKFLWALACLGGLSVHAQKPQQRPLVQFSGVVVTGDSLLPVPFAQIATVGTYRGTVSDVFGYFSFVAQVGDTLGFAAVGFKRDWFVVPDTIRESKYSMIHVMHPDTVQLDPVVVTPWPSKEQFAQAFLNLRLSEDDYQVALRHLNSAEAIPNTRLYQQGGMPTISLLNPIAWAQFMQAWRSGKFKNKK